MPRFNRDKYITEGSYPSDLNDPVVMPKDRKTLVVISNFLGVDWDDEITVMPIPEHTGEYIVNIDGKVVELPSPGDYSSYMVEGVGPDGEEIIFLRRTTGYSSRPVLYIDGEEVNANKVVQAAKLGDPTKSFYPLEDSYSPKEKLDWS